MGIGVGKATGFRLQVTVREQKVGSGTTKGLTRKSEPEETRSRPSLHPQDGNSRRETLMEASPTPSPPGWK